MFLGSANPESCNVFFSVQIRKKSADKKPSVVTSLLHLNAKILNPAVQKYIKGEEVLGENIASQP